MNKSVEFLQDQCETDQRFANLVDEVGKRLARGETVNASDYPEHEDQLTRLLPAMQMMVVVGCPPIGTAAPVKPDTDEQTGRPLGDYSIIREIGRGGMGVVYEAEQLSLHRRVALKVLPFAAIMDQRQLTRFKNEAQAAAGLHHTNIVPVYSVGCDRGVHYYAMQYIEGEPLSQVIAELRQLTGSVPVDDKDGGNGISQLTRHLVSRELAATSDADQQHKPPPVSPADETKPTAELSTERSAPSPASFRFVAELGIQVAEALDHSHQQGIVHRDIKPSNLILDSAGKVWVTDFGLARIESGVSLTMTGDIVGTLRYMSPEQAQSPRAVIDHRTDIYSLGVTLYELLTLQPACGGTSRQELLREIAEDEPISPTKINSSIPRDLAIIVQMAMGKRPEDRYHTAQELADDLTRFLQDRPIHAKLPTPAARVVKWVRRHKGLVASAVVLLLLGSIILGISNVMLARERDQKDVALQAAEANLIQALEAVDHLLTGLTDKRMLDAPHAEPLRRKLAAEALGLCDALLKGNPDDSRVSRRKALAYLQQGRIYNALGENQAAEEALQKSSRQLQQLVGQAEDAATRAQSEASLIQSHLILGGLRARRRQYEESAEVLRDAVEVGQRLVAAHPQSLQNHQLLANSYGQLGVVHKSLGQRENALAAHREAILIWQQLLRDNPDDTEYCVALARAYVNLGLVQREPQAAYEEAIRLTRHAVNSDPSGVLAKETLAKAHMNLATWRKEQGHLEEALDGYQAATAIFESLAQDHPLQPQYRALLGGGYCNQGHTYRAAKKTDEAFSSYVQAVSTLESELSKQEPDRLALQFYLSAQRGRAELLRQLNRDDEVLELWHAVLDAQRQRVEDYPDNPDHAIRLASYTLLLNDFLKRQGKEAESGAAQQDALTLLRNLPESTRQRAAWRETMAGALFCLGGEANVREAIRLYDSLVKCDFSTPAQRFALAYTLNLLGKMMLNRDRFNEAEPLLRRAIHIGEELVARDPVPSKIYMEGLANFHFCLGHLFKKAGHPAECLEPYRQAAALQTEVMRSWPSALEFHKLLFYYKEVCELPCADEQLDERLQWRRDWLAAYDEFEADFADELDSDQPSNSKPCWQNMIAWVLATCPDPRLRDADRAVELAQRAVNHAPEEGQYWDSLATAQYRVGDWEESINSFETSMKLRSGGDSLDSFFMAMAHWQLGQQDESRRWYDRAVEWMEENKPEDKELRRFRAEAARLMEIQDKEEA